MAIKMLIAPTWDVLILRDRATCVSHFSSSKDRLYGYFFFFTLSWGVRHTSGVLAVGTGLNQCEAAMHGRKKTPKKTTQNKTMTYCKELPRHL